jgi:hypothetical protein
MTPQDFIMPLCCQRDAQMAEVSQRPDATLFPSAGVTWARWVASQGGGPRAFSRGLTRDSQAWFPQRPERTRWLRHCTPHTPWRARFLVAPTVLGGAASEGMALGPPRRAGRSPQQMGKQGKSTHRGIVGGKRCFLWHQGGVLCAWALPRRPATTPSVPRDLPSVWTA